jgi:hypothetical protein
MQIRGILNQLAAYSPRVASLGIAPAKPVLVDITAKVTARGFDLVRPGDVISVDGGEVISIISTDPGTGFQFQRLATTDQMNYYFVADQTPSLEKFFAQKSDSQITIERPKNTRGLVIKNAQKILQQARVAEIRLSASPDKVKEVPPLRWRGTFQINSGIIEQINLPEATDSAISVPYFTLKGNLVPGGYWQFTLEGITCPIGYFVGPLIASILVMSVGRANLIGIKEKNFGRFFEGLD